MFFIAQYNPMVGIFKLPSFIQNNRFCKILCGTLCGTFFQNMTNSEKMRKNLKSVYIIISDFYCILRSLETQKIHSSNPWAAGSNPDGFAYNIMDLQP